MMADPNTNETEDNPPASGENVPQAPDLAKEEPAAAAAAGGGEDPEAMSSKNNLHLSLSKPLSAISNAVKKVMKEGPEEPEEFESPIPEDVFSLVYLCETCSWAFGYSIMVYGVQMVIIILILVDLIDLDNSGNPLKIPPGVDIEVTVAQAFSMVLAVSTQTNLLAALSRMALAPSYDHEYVSSCYPNATKTSYRASYSLQCSAGLIMLLANFVLNMQSTTVLSLMLNFAALAFVSEIQEVAFWLAKQGYISVNIQESALEVVNFSIPRQHRNHGNTLIKRVCFVLINVVLLAFYGVLVHQQRSGHFICDKLRVQFGDDFRPDLAFFSDVYSQTGELIAQRAVYEDTKRTGARFAYCADEGAWTFSGPYDVSTASVANKELFLPELHDDPCQYWLKSRATNTYDITETASLGWLVVEFSTNQTLPMDHLFLECNDCEGAKATQSCSGHGTCNDNTCECNDGRLGINCEYPNACTHLALDERTQPFPYASGGLFVPTTSYEILTNSQSEPVLVYNKPVYVAYLAKNKIPLNVLMFTGRRYGLFLNFKFLDANETQQLREGLSSYLPLNFHSWFSTHEVYFFSDVMDTGTPSDGSSPVDLQWYRSRELISFQNRTLYRVDKNQPTNTVLLCPRCQLAFNDCFNGGHCTIDNRSNGTILDFLSRNGECECPYGFTGYLCEKGLDCYSPNATCLNGGNCSTSTGECSCPMPYEGWLCQYELDEQYIDFLEGWLE